MLKPSPFPRRVSRMGGLCAALLALAVQAQSEPEPEPPQGNKRILAEARQFGKKQLIQAARDAVPKYQEGQGTAGAGQVIIGGQAIDLAHLVPYADPERAKEEQAAMYRSATDPEALRNLTRRTWADSAHDLGSSGQSFRTSRRANTRSTLLRRSLRRDSTLFGTSRAAINEGLAGRAGGQNMGHCTTTRTRDRTTGTGWITDELTCTRPDPADDAAVCSRRVEASVSVTEEKRRLNAPLQIRGSGAPALCTRAHRPGIPASARKGSVTQRLNVPYSNPANPVCEIQRQVRTLSPVQVSGQAAATVHKVGFGAANSNCRNTVWVEAPADAQFTVEPTVPGRTVSVVQAQKTDHGTNLILAVTDPSPDNHTACRTEAVPLAITWSGGSQNPAWEHALANLKSTAYCNLAQPPPTCSGGWECLAGAPGAVPDQTTRGQTTVPLTLADVAGLAPLYPGAPAACLHAKLDVQCGDERTAVTVVGTPIWTDLEEGYALENTVLEWLNPDPRLSVTLLEAPGPANGFRRALVGVTNHAAPGEAPPLPNIRLTWDIIGPDEWSIVETGQCDVPGSGTAPPLWGCTLQAPAAVSTGIGSVTVHPGDMAGQPPLYPGAPPLCLRAEMATVPGDASAADTEVAVLSAFPAAVVTVENFQYEILRKADYPGFDLTLVTRPVRENGFRARFRATMSPEAIAAGILPPSAVTVSMQFTVVTAATRGTVRQAGTCFVPEDSACTGEWVCRSDPATDTPGGGQTSVAGSTEASLIRFGSQTTQRHQFGIGQMLPPDTDRVDGLQLHIIKKQAPDQTVTLFSPPTRENNWIVQIDNTSACGVGTATACLSGLLGVTWTAHVGPPRALEDAVLFPGASATCNYAELLRVCTPPDPDEPVCEDTPQGTVCHFPGDVPADDCAALEADTSCRLKTSLCSADGWTSLLGNPKCTEWTDVYACRRAVSGDEPVVTDEIVCEGEMALCADGTCTAPLGGGTTTQDLRKTLARLLLVQGMISDYSVETKENP